MQGAGFDCFADHNNEQKGLQPRVFDYLFTRTREDMETGKCQHLLKCSYFEIYNEQIIDLVAASN